MSAPAIATRVTELAGRFARRFRGLDRAYGSYTPDKEKAGLKLEGKVDTVTAPVTLQLYERHLRGDEEGLGIVPITDEHTCWFGAVDVDQYKGLNHADLDEKIDRLGLPLIVCQTKSGGAHLFVFFSEAVPAALVRARLGAWAEALGQPKGVEIFPKQDQLIKGSKGCWINLPYYGNARPALRSGEPLRLDKFLDVADASAI